MLQLKTPWSDPRKTRPAVVVDSFMFKPGEVVTFKGPDVSVINCGAGQDAVFLRADGLILTDHEPFVRSVMSAPDATWISKNVLSRTYLKSCGGVKLIRRCACQYGECGHCGMGNHDKCATRVGFNGKPSAAAHTHLVGRRGGALAPVHTTGTPCRWICPCPTCIESPAKTESKAFRKVTGNPRPGDTVWLTPKTLGCPAICWKQPRATVVSVLPAYLLVEIDGKEHRIHVDNIRHSDPVAVKPREPRPSKPRKPMPDGYTEQALF